MQNIFGLLFLGFLILWPLSVFKPDLFSKLIKGTTRRKNAVIFGGIALLFFTLTEITAPTSTHVQSVKGTETTNLQTNTPTQTPTLTPTPTPTLTPPPTPTLKPTVELTPTPTSIPTVTPTSNSGLSNDNYYKSVDGDQVHSPAYSNTVPAGATAICGDGTYSFSQHRSGTCSHHGGVAQWL